MLPIQQFSPADKEDLYDSFKVFLCHTDHVPVLARRIFHLLGGCNRYSRIQKLLPLSGFLILHRISGFFHFIFYVCQDLFGITLQEPAHGVDPLCIFLLCDLPGARCVTFIDMMIQTRTLFSNIPRQHPAAGTQMINRIQ